jgi:hypothetical protein
MQGDGEKGPIEDTTFGSTFIALEDLLSAYFVSTVGSKFQMKIIVQLLEN